MKKFKKLIFVILLSFSLISCNSQETYPKDTSYTVDTVHVFPDIYSFHYTSQKVNLTLTFKNTSDIFIINNDSLTSITIKVIERMSRTKFSEDQYITSYESLIENQRYIISISMVKEQLESLGLCNGVSLIVFVIRKTEIL